MICPKCKIIEMKMDRVVEDTMHFKCKQCGVEIEKSIQEIEELGKKDD